MGKNRHFFGPCDLENWPMTLKNNRVPISHLWKAAVKFQSHWQNKTGVIIRKRSKSGEIGQNRHFSGPCDLEIWRMTLKINRAPLPYPIKLGIKFHSNRSNLSGVIVRKRQNGFLTPVTLTFDLWPRNCAEDDTLVKMNNPWKNHDDPIIGTYSKRCDGRTDGRTDRRTDGQTDRRHRVFIKLLGRS